mgnify:CR=1 FL=1
MGEVVDVVEVDEQVLAEGVGLADSGSVEQGGTVITQYNRPGRDIKTDRLAPFALTLGGNDARVTDEDAAITLLEPNHPAFNSPNKLTPADWTGWVQERGAYFGTTWGPEFTPLLACNDEPYCLELVEGGSPGHDHFAFELAVEHLNGGGDGGMIPTFSSKTLTGGGILPLERLVMAAPEVIVTSTPYPGASRSEEILAHPALAAIRRDAARAKVSDADWVCGTPVLLNAIRTMAEARRSLGGTP